MATREDFMRMPPDERRSRFPFLRKEETPFGHMVLDLETPSRFALGETVQAVVVRKVWNGKDYVNGDSAEGIDVWNAVITDLHNLKITVSGIVEGLKVFEATMQTWTANVKAQVDAIDKNLGVPLEERIKVIFDTQLALALAEREDQKIEAKIKTIDWTGPVASQIEDKIKEVVNKLLDETKALIVAAYVPEDARFRDPGHTSQLSNEQEPKTTPELDHHQV